MKLDEKMLTGSVEDMDAPHKELYGILSDISTRIARKDYTKQDIEEYSYRITNLIDNDTSKKVVRGTL